MWEKGGKNKPVGFDLNHQKDRTARSSVFRCEEPTRPSNRDIEWTLRSGVKKGIQAGDTNFEVITYLKIHTFV